MMKILKKKKNKNSFEWFVVIFNKKKGVITLPQVWKILYFLSENQLIMDSG